MPSGLLTNHATTTADTSIDAIIDINTIIDVEEIVLSCVRVEMDSEVYALAEKIVYVDVPFLNSTNMIDGVSYMSRLPIPLQDLAVTHFYPNIKLSLHSVIPRTYNLRVYSRSGRLCTNIKSITLQFNYSN